MALQLEIVSEQRELVGDDAVREFDNQGGTIGRSLECDWILPDPNRYISSRHASIDYKGGIYYLLDTSSNGVYVNGEKEPIGKGNSRRLFNGDRLRLGDFEVVVSIDAGESLSMPLDPPDSVGPDIELLIPEEDPKTGISMIDAEEITGDKEFQSAILADDPAPSNLPTLEVDEVDDIPSAPPPPKPERIEMTGVDVFDAFLDGLKISRADLHPSVDIAEVMNNAGEVLREYVAGTEKLIAGRSRFKTAFRLDQTTILPRHNNPLKLSEDVDASVKQLLVGQTGEYLGPRDAVREVCRDLMAHQDAFLDAMSAAFAEFAERFDPDELRDNFDNALGRKPIFEFLSKVKYWELYCDVYPIMTEKGGGDFPQTFSEEFVKAYESLINQLLNADGINKTAPQPVLDVPGELETLQELVDQVTDDSPPADEFKG